MSRLIVKAISGEMFGLASASELKLHVSVSRASNGKAVTGLTKDNFRLASADDVVISNFGENKWQPENSELSGCYRLSLTQTPPPSNWTKSEFFAFSLQVRTFKAKKAVDFGQTLVSIQKLAT
jgi:hypothetical protein